MNPNLGFYLGGALHGLGIGLVSGWFLNSAHAFAGSTRSGVIFPVVILLVTVGTTLNRQAAKKAAPAQAEATCP